MYELRFSSLTVRADVAHDSGHVNGALPKGPKPGRQVVMAEQQAAPVVSALRAAGRAAPLGLPGTPPRLSWSASADGPFEVTTSTGWSATVTRPWIEYAGPALASRQRVTWQVQRSEAAFEVGLLNAADWRATWITGHPERFPRESHDPAPILEHDFTASGGVARVYATALGLYRLWLNGVELTAADLYRPGWTDYRTRVHHQTYAARLLPGRNTIRAVLAKGWYAGRLGLLREPGFYGDLPAFLAQVEEDGEVVAATDSGWRTAKGPILSTDLLRGEIQDLRREPEEWAGALPFEGPVPDVVPQPHDSITGYEIHEGRLVHEHARGPAVFDFGQNLVGWTRLTTPTVPSVEVIVRHGEILTPENLVYRDNLRGAFQEDRYTVPGEGPHVLEPAFTMHGFRYAEVWGLPGDTPYGMYKVRPETRIEAVSVTGLPLRAGWFESSNAALTRLASNVEWTVRDNFLEAATDCPQRDERHGWLGDAGVIAPTAAYHFDISAFLAKFAQDAADAQGPDGEIPNYVPAVPPSGLTPGAPGWSDGFIRLVHTAVQRYGDLGTARRLFPNMVRFLDHVDRANPDGLRVNQTGADFGDWLSLPEREGTPFHFGYEYTGAHSTTPRPVVGTAHSYRSFVQLAEIAAWLGETGEAARLAERAEEIRQAYLKAFLPLREPTQTAFAQAIGYGLVRGADAAEMAAELRHAIERAGRVTTGIHGVEHVLPVLSAHGHADFATRLLLKDEMPSWLYMVAKGATTIWEKWDGIRPDGTLSTAEMNSFNHCALGAVGRHLFEGVAGLDATTTTWTGEIVVRARYTRDLDWVRAGYDSPVGPIRSSWRWAGQAVEHEIEVPGAAFATVHLPEAEPVRLGPGIHTVHVELP